MCTEVCVCVCTCMLCTVEVVCVDYNAVFCGEGSIVCSSELELKG